jgi:transposase-like protein
MAGRRQYNAEFKAKVVLAVLSGEKTQERHLSRS